MDNFIYARGDDWEGLYVDGKLVTEGHRIDSIMMAKYTAKTSQEPKVVWCDQNWLEGMGNLPERFEDVWIEKDY